MDELGAANGASNSGNIGFADMSDNDDAEVAFLVHGAGGSVAVYYAKNADAKSTIEEDDFEPLGVMSEGNAPQAFDLA